ncbi:MAG TPA: farnesyl diphosphate synthase [Oleiagrimonas sp.]|nr:farnesyl diphosphate synthase [Oleiagrimonas sp.]
MNTPHAGQWTSATTHCTMTRIAICKGPPVDSMTSFESRVPDYVDRAERALDARLPAAATAPSSLHEAMRYAILGGGKRVRPLLCYATGEVLGIDPDRLDDPACAVEMIHGFSLVHDDLPSMDDDALRRGRPTVHKAYGTAAAILAGDALQTLAFAVLADGKSASASRIGMVRTLAQATGSLGMTGGQTMDLEAESRHVELAELEELNRRKTGCLIRAAVALACDALPGLDAGVRRRLGDFADSIGLAFQIRDDLLDVEGDENLTGKAGGADAAHGKSTWPGLLGLDAARQRADSAYSDAMQALQPLGDSADPLRWMAEYIVQRNH